MYQTDSQLDGLVPHDGVTGQRERLDVHDVHVAVVGPDVHPLGLERQVTVRYPAFTAQQLSQTDPRDDLPVAHRATYRCERLLQQGLRDRPKFGFGYGVSAETTQKYGFGLVSVTAKRNGRITVSAET